MSIRHRRGARTDDRQSGGPHDGSTTTTDPVGLIIEAMVDPEVAPRESEALMRARFLAHALPVLDDDLEPDDLEPDDLEPDDLEPDELAPDEPDGSGEPDGVDELDGVDEPAVAHPVAAAMPRTMIEPTTTDHDDGGGDAGGDGGDDDEGDDDEPVRVHDPGRRRRRMALVVVGVALLSAVGGGYIGTRLRSPAEAASQRQAPTPSRITVPVERRSLSSTLTLSGDIQFAEPFAVKLAGSVGLAEGDAAVVTRLPGIEQPVTEGDAVLDVSGRPVFFMVGAAPMYRSLESGSVGPDVLAVEEALVRLGFNPGLPDQVFDGYTEAALDAFYLSRGYPSVGPSPADTERLRQLRLAITSAQENVRTAEANLTSASQRPKDSELLALQQAVASAEAAVPRAQTTSQRNNDSAAQAVKTATTTRDSATTKRSAAKTQLDAVKAPGAIDPSTGEAYTASAISVFQVALADADAALATAELELTNATANQAAVASQGEADITAATNALTLAQSQLADATKPADTSAAQRAVTQAKDALDQANLDYTTADAAIGTRLPAGEIVFVPSLPSTVTGIAAVVGSAPTGDLMTLSSSDTTVIAKVGRADSGLVTVGAAVVIQLRDYDLEFPGTVTYVGQPKASASDDGGDGSGDSSSGSRLQVTVAPDDPVAIADYVYSSVKILIEVAATDDQVLAVPVAAVSVGSDGSSRVEVERRPTADGDAGATELVTVEVGLSAQGYVEVRPIGGAALDEGDRVVVGITDADGTTSAGATTP